MVMQHAFVGEGFNRDPVVPNLKGKLLSESTEGSGGKYRDSQKFLPN
jgi:hypothetical protein